MIDQFEGDAFDELEIGFEDGFADESAEEQMELFADAFSGEDDLLLDGFTDDLMFDGLDEDDPFADDLFDAFDDSDGFAGDLERGDAFGVYDAFDAFSAYDAMDGWDGFDTADPMIPSDAEVDEFLGKLFRKVGRFVKKGVTWLAKKAGPLIKKLAPVAAKVLGGVVGGPAGAAIASALTTAIAAESEGESEAEVAAEAADAEADFEAVGGDLEASVLMELFAAEAAEAESEAEADYAIGRMALMTRQILRRHPKLRPVYPRIARAAAALAKTFRANPRTRSAIRLIPVIVRDTLVRLARHRGPITPRLLVTVMAKASAQRLATPNRAALALRRHRRIVARGRGKAKGRPRRVAVR